MFGAKIRWAAGLVSLFACMDAGIEEAVAQSRDRGGKGSAASRGGGESRPAPSVPRSAPSMSRSAPSVSRSVASRPATFEKSGGGSRREPSYSRPTTTPSSRPSSSRPSPVNRPSFADRTPASSPARVSASSISREPLVRVPESVARDVPRIKDHVSTFPPSDARPIDRDRPRYTVPGTPNNFHADARRGDTSGLIRIGTDPFHVSIGNRYGNDFSRRYHYRPFRSVYDPRHYYHGYRPIYYPGCRSYSPWYGYAYTSVYLTEPYVVRVYDDDDDPVVYYQESPSYQTTTAVESAPAAESYSAPSEGVYPAPDGEAYQPLPAAAQNTLVSDGNAAFTAGRYEDARRLYTRAVMADERDGYAKMLLGWASFAVGDYDGAAAAIRRALLTTDDLVNYPMDVRTFYPDAAVLNHQMDSLVQFTQSRPDDREAQLVLAYFYYSVGQAERSASLFNGLVERDRNDTLAATVRDAVVRAERGQTASPRP